MTFKVQSIVVTIANDFLLNILSGLNQIKISRLTLLTIMVDVLRHKGPLHANWISSFDNLQARVLILSPNQVSWIQESENQVRDKNRIGRDLYLLTDGHSLLQFTASYHLKKQIYLDSPGRKPFTPLRGILENKRISHWITYNSKSSKNCKK